jgi:protein-S-isoprenylcysteine O-methyltransferase Ste14
VFLLRLALGVAAQVALIAALLFVPAGTWRWPRAWVLLGVFAGLSVIAIAVMLRRHRGVLEERMRPPLQRDQPAADKVVATLLVATILGAVAMVPVDVFHLHLGPEPVPVVRGIGLAAFAGGFAIMCVAMMQNDFAAAVIRHQAERGHAVADRGLYAVVRHPMYAGAIPWMLGIPLWLGSYAGMAAFAAPIVVLAVRIGIEERFLARELEGYEAYRRRVRYRLIPLLW